MAQLVFLHGAADSGAVWEHQTEFFGSRHEVLALDLPGHGTRLVETPLSSVELIAGEAMRAARDRGMTHPVLIGHSMGGATAIRIGLDDPSFPSALVLVGTGARLRIRSELIEEARMVAESAPPGQIVDRLVSLESATSSTALPDVLAWLSARFGQATGTAVHADFTATSGFDALDRIGEIRLPTLIIAGEDDAWTPPKFQHYMAERIAGSRVVMLPGAGHYPFVEQAERFNQELDRFLKELEGAPGS